MREMMRDPRAGEGELERRDPGADLFLILLFASPATLKRSGLYSIYLPFIFLCLSLSVCGEASRVS